MLIYAVLPCHNRANLTLACLASLQKCILPEDTKLVAIVVDDGSLDGTSDKVAQRFPYTVIIRGDGSWYWGGAIVAGTNHALQADASAVLWVNDDVTLDPRAIELLVSAWRRHGDHIYVGSVYDSAGDLMYGGYRLKPFFHFALVPPPVGDGELQEVDTMNGNCVLIPRVVLDRVSPPDPKVYVHNGGDMEYALRARKNGYRVLLVGGVRCIGTPNPRKISWLEPGVPVRKRWQQFQSQKGFYPPMRWHFCTTYGGWLGPLYFVRPYLTLAARSVRQMLMGQ